MKGTNYVSTITKTQDGCGNELITFSVTHSWLTNSESGSSSGTQVRTVTIRKMDPNISQAVCKSTDDSVQMESY